MPRLFRRLAAALGAVLLIAPTAEAGYDVRMSSVRDGLYRLYGVGVLLDMRGCMRPCAKCTAFLDTETHEIVFTERACAIDHAYREVRPTLGRTDLVLTPRGRDFYVTPGRDWLFETEGCTVRQPEVATRVVIDGRADRLLMSVPDHAEASVTGRVSCRIEAVYIEVEL